ncbi:9393_t:CDS:2 [Paraglomus brasilianum]|uniref:9393_t:CDS:1 n=1 Tax=Paraglomus brasilianum TaxID=144538 RepID=A0A9N9H7F3_9GLOM|nr:9393_t:CDS:2 [Paraglomus brasilianum]
MALSANAWTSLPVYLTISVSYVSMVIRPFADAWKSSVCSIYRYDSLHDYFVMALSANAWTSFPVYDIVKRTIIDNIIRFHLNYLPSQITNNASFLDMDFHQSISSYILGSEYKGWNALSCLNHLKDHHIQFTSDSKQEVLDAFMNAFKEISESDIVKSRTTSRAKKIYNNAHDTFERKEIIEFFEKMDQEFDARQNERELERSFDRNGCELLKKSSDFNTLKLLSRYAEKSSEVLEKVLSAILFVFYESIYLLVLTTFNFEL